MTTLVAFDTETHLIGPYNVAPKMVCATFASFDEDAKEQTLDYIGTEIHAACDPALPGLIQSLLEDPEVIIVTQFGAYDFAVCSRTFPQLIPYIFAAYDAGRIHCTKIREKLKNLSVFGKLELFTSPDGVTTKFKYGLGDLIMNYAGIDISKDKTAADSWRLNYHMLEGKPIEEYPKEAQEYAMNDAAYTLLVYVEQEKHCAEIGGSMETHEFQAAADFALYLTTCQGMQIDETERARIQAMLETELAPEKMTLLLKSGILDPGSPPRPHKTDPSKSTKGKEPSIKRAPLQALVESVCNAHGIEVKQTDKGAVSCDADVMDTIAELDPILMEYKHRQELQKLVTTELPRMQAETVHFPFDVLKETGRTSSKASDLFPSANGQNIDPRARGAYVARPGWLILSVDYSSIELVTAAQKQLERFGRSTLADLINSGGDPHGFLGAQMAYSFDEKFREACDKADCQTKNDIYKVFMGMKNHNVKEIADFFTKYRTFAKPTGLGYPGGLGAETFVTYAKGSYGVVISLEQAEAFKRIWLDSFPEFQMGFNWLESIHDPNFPENYRYVSPFGMVRSNASYCAAANGDSLQTPAAEGGKLAFYELVKACYDTSQTESQLLGCHTLNWVHDEAMLEIPDDEFAHERACEVQRIMQECMRKVTPDVAVRTEAKLMRRWDKGAKTVFSPEGRLIPYEGKNT